MWAFKLAEAMRQAISDHKSNKSWLEKKQEAFEKNGWFTPTNIDQAMDQWITSLDSENVETWLNNTAIPNLRGQTLGIIMAGNLPLVGMHDALCGLICGMNLKIKLSSDDEVLPKYWLLQAMNLLPELQDRLDFSENMKGIDAAIATGSNNSAGYFEYYFRKMPHLLRKNRNSVSILNGHELPAILHLLGHDVFDFYGLGCRNVTHLYLPENYAFKPLFDAWEPFSEVINHHKYANNYNYHKALLLLNLDPHMDTGYLLLKERADIYSPVGMLNYSFYSNLDELKEKLTLRENQIQCVTSEVAGFDSIKPGMAQQTMLWDYADNVNTLAWLASIAKK